MKKFSILSWAALTSLVCSILVGCSSKPIQKESLTVSDYKSATDAVTQFKSDERLASYFSDAVAYAVFPKVVRAGVGFGAAYGTGWVFQGESVPTGKASVWQINFGPQGGAQYYQQILFFKTEKSLSRFQRGTLEFGGQANLTALTAGISSTPGYNNAVAVFTKVKGGLMIEASAGGHRYDYRPIEAQ